jgi:spermidine/putrescine-binding protein
MKLRWLVCALVPALLLLAACAPAAPVQPIATAAPVEPAAPAAPAVAPSGVTSTELNLYAWSEYVPQKLLDDFSAKYSVKVNYDTYSSNEEMLAKLQAGASGYDVVIPSDYMVAVMLKLDLLEPLVMTQIPNFANIDPQFRNQYYDPGNKYTVPYMWGTSALAYNKANVPFEPKSWADLWKPAFQNKLVMLDDSREVPAVALQLLGYDKNTTNPDELEQAKQKLIELKPNILLFNSDDPETPLITGEVWAGLVYNGNAALGYAEDENIAYICPTEGCGLWFDNLAVPKGSPHVDAAMGFINFVLEPAESILITAEFPYSNPNSVALEYLKTSDPEAYAAYMGFSGTNPPPEFLKAATPIKDVGEATTLYDQLWTDFKGE